MKTNLTQLLSFDVLTVLKPGVNQASSSIPKLKRMAISVFKILFQASEKHSESVSTIKFCKCQQYESSKSDHFFCEWLQH
mmetsp:Transcript_23009/g.54284  ORF Transcript_23009/g.54284 Transcript_23009/m.54284 type:complete len:80 (-) Transcript_23009:1082-1321(-)